MKLSTLTIVVAFGLSSVVQAESKYKVIDYLDATSKASTNVQWTVVGGDKAVVNKFASSASYTSNTCDVETKDLGYITVDFGSSQFLDGVRLYLDHQGGPKKYCNLFVNIWDNYEQEPLEPLDKPLTLAPKPTSSPTSKPTLRPTSSPTHSPTQSPTESKKQGPRSCHRCLGPKFICEIKHGPMECPPEKPYCGTTIENLNNGRRYIQKFCVSQAWCEKEWIKETADRNECEHYDEQIVFSHFFCDVCCVGDNCNAPVMPERNSLYQIGGPRRNLQSFSNPLAGTNIYSSGTDHQYGPVATAEGMDIPISPPSWVRYVRVWVGANSVDDQVRVLEVQPLEDASAVQFEQSSFSIPIESQIKSASSRGDPHFTTFSGHKFDFHGGCDLVLVNIPNFFEGLGLRVHIRTKISTWWSSIETAVLQIGSETLEVTGGEDGGRYWLNGKEGEKLEDGSHIMISSFQAVFHQVTPKQARFRIDFIQGAGDVLSIQTLKDFVQVNLRARNAKNFDGALGLMGSYPTGAMMARDGQTVIEDPDEFGQEWQVLESEPMLFHDVGYGVHHPESCIMPSNVTETMERRLTEAKVTEEAAKLACAKVESEDLDACIFDVLATQDTDMVGSY